MDNKKKLEFFFRILDKAIKNIPPLKYLYGIIAVGSVLCILRIMGISFPLAVVAVIVCILLMILLVLFVQIATLEGPKIKKLALFIAWAVFIIPVIVIGTLFSCVFFGEPLNRNELKSFIFKDDGHRTIKLKVAIASSAAVAIEEEIKGYENVQKSAFKSQKIDFSIEITRFTNEHYIEVMDNLESGKFDIVMVDDPFVLKYESNLTDLRTIGCLDQDAFSSKLNSQFISNLFL